MSVETWKISRGSVDAYFLSTGHSRDQFETLIVEYRADECEHPLYGFAERVPSNAAIVKEYEVATAEGGGCVARGVAMIPK